MKVRASTGDVFPKVRETLRSCGLRTICDSAHCPNLGYCWSRGHATFLILGRTCTRSCAFCAVDHGVPEPLDREEPMRIASAVAELGLKHVVITSVTRDDLPDQGAGQYRAVLDAIHSEHPSASIELLIPDMRASEDDLRSIVESGPDVLGHNIETVRRLQDIRDPRSTYEGTLETLRTIRRLDPYMVTKSSLMLGLGERYDEVIETLGDLRKAGTETVVMGQYLRPRNGLLEVHEYVHPEIFQRLSKEAQDLGFRHVASGPLMRSSFPTL